MTRRPVYVKLDPRVDEAIRRYAAGHGIGITATISLLVVRGLETEGITIGPEALTPPERSTQ